MNADTSAVKVYTDGSYCSYKGLGFPCGWAAVFPDPQKPASPRVISGNALNLADSGCVEVRAVINALQSLPASSRVEFFIDNRELANLVERYAKASPEKRLKLRGDYLEDEANVRITHDRDALREMFDGLDKHQASASWIRSHQSNAHEHHFYNNIADAAAREAREATYALLDDSATPPRGGSPLQRR